MRLLLPVLGEPVFPLSAIKQSQIIFAVMVAEELSSTAIPIPELVSVPS
jgi:hypothetical protein